MFLSAAEISAEFPHPATPGCRGSSVGKEGTIGNVKAPGTGGGELAGDRVRRALNGAGLGGPDQGGEGGAEGRRAGARAGRRSEGPTAG